MSYMKIENEKYTVEFTEPVTYVDNKARNRSGHMTHAMCEFKPGCFIDFNSNCSAIRHGGHMPYGWVEYKISRDNGKTYSDFKRLEYSWNSFLDGIHSISVEKAIACDDGTIVALCLRNGALEPGFCEPWDTPTVIRSTDEGETWSEPVVYSEYAGRTYDARYHNGVIYALHLCNEHFLGSKPEHVYRIYTSKDNGVTFEELCVVPFPDIMRRGYGSLIFDAEGNLHVFAYNEAAERDMDHAVSKDGGKTWEIMKPCYVAKGIRNPQTAYLDGVYILHGRAEDCNGFVFYTSEDLQNWDEGTYLHERKVLCYYSNNMVLEDENGKFLLVQYSHSYEDHAYAARVNVNHVELRVKKK